MLVTGEVLPEGSARPEADSEVPVTNVAAAALGSAPMGASNGPVGVDASAVRRISGVVSGLSNAVRLSGPITLTALGMR